MWGSAIYLPRYQGCLDRCRGASARITAGSPPGRHRGVGTGSAQ
ncbi:hypothetical protein I549_1700 [Mycobacterium avium subsp. avium 2285 (R)]|nr:hypothetical protein L837_0754 [Mycobacterium avium MAV_061107_1842]ETZ53630.1 hypothetical protein L838_2111 [Mycobacterium avium MAV_120709_2344]ETZ59835.1 hypothetical protein L840_2119 [Mycobacterium sp. MAC_011194_8550]ETZ66669.1 hypothetical protein L841_3592 [Mycobacterium sp. MAC_080597_8934]EUA40392.1 hypothetical protein I549_1700 [Mycobacterium avium subsp. avium 2285 (R)]